MVMMAMRTDRLPKMLSSSVLSRRHSFDGHKQYAERCSFLAALPEDMSNSQFRVAVSFY